MAYRRMGVVHRQRLVCRAVAIRAGGGGQLSRGQSRVGAVFPRRLRIGMAIGAGNLPGRDFVRQALYVFVAIDAREHAAMDGGSQPFFIHEEAVRLAVPVFCERGVAMARKAVPIFQFVLRLEGVAEEKKGERNASQQNKSYRAHPNTLRLWPKCRSDSDHNRIPRLNIRSLCHLGDSAKACLGSTTYGGVASTRGECACRSAQVIDPGIFGERFLK